MSGKWERSYEVAGAIGRVLFLGLLLFLGVGCAFAVILSAVAFYRSSQGIAYRDIESLVQPTADLKEFWSNNGELSTLQGDLAKRNEELLDITKHLDKTDQIALSKLQTVSANLSYLEEVLRNKKYKAASIVGELDAKVKALEKKLNPPDAAATIIETLFKETGGIFLAVIWPLVIVVIFFYLLHSKQAPERLRSLLSGFKSLKVGVAELVLNNSDKAKATTEGTFVSLREQAMLHFDLWVQRKSIRQKVEDVVDKVMEHFQIKAEKELPPFRCTLHVPDIVFADALYQLLDYLPTGGGRGRVFSVRFGMIGKVWRLRQSETQGSVKTREDLVANWGMTSEEAKLATRDRKSFLCVLLRDDKESLLGTFYMDSQPENAFDIPGEEAATLHEFIKEQCKDKGLVEALAKIKDELSGVAPLIRVYAR